MVPEHIAVNLPIHIATFVYAYTKLGMVQFSYDLMGDYNMIVWILAGNYISFTIAAGLIRLHMPCVKKSRV